MQLSAAHQRGSLALPSSRGVIKIKQARAQCVRPCAKASSDDASTQIAVGAASLALLLAANPALADSSSYEDMMKEFQARKTSTLQTYEDAAKKNSGLVKPNPAPPVSDRLPFFNERSDSSAAPAESSKPAAKVVDVPKAAPTFTAPKIEAPKIDMPKFDVPKFEAPKIDVPKPVTPPPVAAPKPVAPVVTAPAPPPAPVVKPYVPPPPPLPSPPPAPKPAASQGDFMDRWSKDNSNGSSSSSSSTVAPRRAPAAAKKQAVEKKPQQKTRSAKRQGPLPLWLAEFVIVGIFGGFVFAAINLQDALVNLYKSADKALEELTTKKD